MKRRVGNPSKCSSRLLAPACREKLAERFIVVGFCVSRDPGICSISAPQSNQANVIAPSQDRPQPTYHLTPFTRLNKISIRHQPAQWTAGARLAITLFWGAWRRRVKNGIVGNSGGSRKHFTRMITYWLEWRSFQPRRNQSQADPFHPKQCRLRNVSSVA